MSLKYIFYYRVAISPARVTINKQLAGKVALEIPFPGCIASALVRARVRMKFSLGLDVLS